MFDLFYSHFSHQHVLAALAAFLRVVILLQEYEGTNVVSCDAVMP